LSAVLCEYEYWSVLRKGARAKTPGITPKRDKVSETFLVHIPPHNDLLFELEFSANFIGSFEFYSLFCPQGVIVSGVKKKIQEELQKLGVKTFIFCPQNLLQISHPFFGAQ
jgi:hypothetical protein